MQEQTIINLKWDTFSAQLTNSLDACYENEHFVDLSLVCKNGIVLKCHKIILSNASSFFHRLLVKNEHHHPMIILHDVEADDLKTILNFVYCGEIQLMKSEVRRIIKIAETLEVSGLKDIAKTLLIMENNECDENSEESPLITTTDPKKPAKNNMAADISNSNESIIRKTAPNGKRTPTKGKSYNFRKRKVNMTYNEDNDGSRSPILRNAASETSKVVNTIEKTAKDERTSAEKQLSWNEVLNEISKEEQISLKRLCLMNEIEITARPSTSHEVVDGDLGTNDTEASSSSSALWTNTDCGVFIKDELDIPCEWSQSDSAEIEKYDYAEPNTQTIDSPIEIIKKAPCVVEAESLSPKDLYKLLNRKCST